MKFKVQLSDEAKGELSNLPAKIQRQIVAKLKLLEDNPHHNAKKLTGHSALRVRSGNYRIVYEIENSTMTVVVFIIADRKSVYRRLK